MLFADDIKMEMYIMLNSKKYKELDNDINQLKLIEKKIRNNNYISTIISIIIFIIINSFRRTYNYILDYNYFKDSKITLKINGTRDNWILSNDFRCSRDVSYIGACLKEVDLNYNKQDDIEKRYFFNQTENFVELIFKDNINSCENMFSSCPNIIEINLSDFNTSSIESMESMFNGCSSLTLLNLSNFDTSKVTNMDYMFNECSSLTFLNLSIFNTSLVQTMNSMFCGCKSLKILNIFDFDTSLVTTMDSMFSRCSSLTSLNLSNFDTSVVTNMYFMFNNCSSLTSLN